MIRGAPEGGFTTDTHTDELDTPAEQAGQGRQPLAQPRGAVPATYGVPLQPPAMFSLPASPYGGHAYAFSPFTTFPGPAFHPGMPYGPHAGVPYLAPTGMVPWIVPAPNAPIPLPAYPGIASAPGALPPTSATPTDTSRASTEVHTDPRVRAQRLADAAPGQRYTRAALDEQSELVITEASTEGLVQLTRALPDNETITQITLDGNHPETVKATLDALRHNQNVQTLRIELSLVDFAPKLVDKLTALLERKTPLQQLELIVASEGAQKFNLDQAFFMALFTHPHLASFKLHGLYSERVYLHSPQQLAAAVRNNTSLKHLKLFRCQEIATLFQAIAPGLEGNHTLKVLDLRRSMLRDCGPAMAAMLKANKSIERLNMQLSSYVSADDWAQVIDALAANTTVEEFYFHNLPSSGDRRPALGASLGAMLKSNKTLTSLSIYSKLDLANITLIQQGLHANTSLRFFDPGDFLSKENTPGTADATDALSQLFATNTRLTAVKLRLPPARALKGLERNRSISSVWMKDVDGIDDVVQLLNNNPHITDLKLTRFMDQDIGDEVIAQRLEGLVDRISGNTTLLKLSIGLGDTGKLAHPAIAKAIARLEGLTLRNRQLDKERQQQQQRIAAPALGLQMLSNFQHNDDEHWPTLGEAEALAIATGIDSFLPPEQSQSVLDALRFADIRPS